MTKECIILGEGTEKETDKKEDCEMAVLAKPINRIAIIKQENSKQFVREFNTNKVSKEFMESCNKAGKLFRKDK